MYVNLCITTGSRAWSGEKPSIPSIVRLSFLQVLKHEIEKRLIFVVLPSVQEVCLSMKTFVLHLNAAAIDGTNHLVRLFYTHALICDVVSWCA